MKHQRLNMHYQAYLEQLQSQRLVEEKSRPEPINALNVWPNVREIAAKRHGMFEIPPLIQRRASSDRTRFSQWCKP